MVGVLRQGEDNLVGALVVVGIEELGIVAVERVALGYGVVASLDALSILGCAGVNLGIEIKLCQQCVGSSLRSLAVRAIGLRGKISHTVLQLRLYVVECLLRSVAWRNVRSDRVVLRHKWDVAVEIESMEIEQSTHETGLCLIAAKLLLVGFRERRDLRVGAIAQELVAERDVVINTIVHVRHPSVVGIPLHKRDVGHVVARKPRVGHLVGRSFLKVEEGAHVVLAMIGRIVHARAFLACGCHRGINLSKHSLIVLHVGVHLLRGGFVVRILVEVVGAGGV